ncbi:MULTISPECIES: GNAT family N-acetyltransferase [unclassified Pseudomonas]|uniref:GNAT family N-acetyltransferase n=1 Tax=unclassified Pseudomonas TaxID=196821 RepID=UPI002AC96FEC|nr:MULTISPECIES: GNAT family N-acetyltransferase [unclassified Pseudomonas]MEB0042906.1 GNAT family N-acetyltransferase [Pseudomonas sp. MH10]MEB0120366.1 GNAT family N-acetyltransferase [Pseudomonas sp. CCI1.2]WPX65577.1 GNAT family N-acetyltransferase [Pseudomonas sp. MH10]
MPIELLCYEDLTDIQRKQLLRIKVLDAQRSFSGDIYGALNSLLVNATSDIRGFALLTEGLPVGFLLLKRGIYLPAWAQADAATLHSLQIDRRRQGQGLGKACLQALANTTRRVWPDIKQLMLSVDTDNTTALGLYASQGWVDTGEAYRGRIGYERRLALKLFG